MPSHVLPSLADSGHCIAGRIRDGERELHAQRPLPALQGYLVILLGAEPLPIIGAGFVVQPSTFSSVNSLSEQSGSCGAVKPHVAAFLCL